MLACLVVLSLGLSAAPAAFAADASMGSMGSVMAMFNRGLLSVDAAKKVRLGRPLSTLPPCTSRIAFVPAWELIHRRHPDHTLLTHLGFATARAVSEQAHRAFLCTLLNPRERPHKLITSRSRASVHLQPKSSPKKKPTHKKPTKKVSKSKAKPHKKPTKKKPTHKKPTKKTAAKPKPTKKKPTHKVCCIQSTPLLKRL